jgi:agmatine deiminase
MAPDLPASLGYRMPAEWEPHEATWLAWPRNRDTWPHQLEQVEALYVQIIAALQADETVNVLVNDTAMASRISRVLATHGVSETNLHLLPCATADAWLRDTGPSFVTASAGAAQPLALVDWHFNAWGEKYPELIVDTELPRWIADHLGVPRFCPDMVLEGGSIDLNGQGSCLTTEQCLLHPNRNPHLGRDTIERFLHDYLEVRHVIWLGEGIVGDDTDGHIDDIARFVAAATVVCAVQTDPADDNYHPLLDNYRRLRAATDQNGRPLQVIPLPMPEAVWGDGERLPASYANFYIANGVVLVPTYNCPQDKVALETLQNVFPTRRVIGMVCTSLVWGLGAIHCITQQQPTRPV